MSPLFLLRWSLRDLRRAWVQVAAVALVIAKVEGLSLREVVLLPGGLNLLHAAGNLTIGMLAALVAGDEAALEEARRRRAGFLDHHFWATRYKPEELYAAGTYPNQGGEGEGLPRFVSDNESLVNEDVVAWYTVGITHIPRPEEWPVMPATHLGFKLIPVGFFDRNPAMDLPRLK